MFLRATDKQNFAAVNQDSTPAHETIHVKRKFQPSAVPEKKATINAILLVNLCLVL